MEEKKSYHLSIFLLKEEIKSYEQALKPNISILKRYKLKPEVQTEGLVIIGRTKSQEVNWKNLLQQGIEEWLPDLENSSNRALAFFTIDKRIFVLPFGYGKHLLKEDVIEQDFGLRTTLNIVNADKLISVDKANLDNLTVLTKTQTSIKAKLHVLNIDVIKDLLKSVTGEPSIDGFGKIITGNEGVSIIPNTDFLGIVRNLKELKKAYQSNKYKERFGWIDNLKEEKDPSIIDILKEKLIQSLKNKDEINIHLAPPFLLDWSNFEGFSYTPKGNAETDFDISNFYSQRASDLLDLDRDKLSRLFLYLKFANAEDFRMTLWRFINYQTEHNGYLYVFTLLKWYRINKKYADELIDYVKNIEESKSPFINCFPGINEEKYNIALAESQKNYHVMDGDLVKSDLSRSEIEVCDVLTDQMEFMHVKFRRSSATLSHLFAQGRISAYALRRDKTFRKNLRKKIKKLGLKPELIPLENKDVDADNYTITFVLIEKKSRPFVEALPFFSLLNFRLTAEDLIMAGFKVRIKKIEIK